MSSTLREHLLHDHSHDSKRIGDGLPAVTRRTCSSSFADGPPVIEVARTRKDKTVVGRGQLAALD